MAIAACWLAVRATGAVVLVENGKAAGSLLVGRGAAGSPAAEAVADLGRVLEKMTGVRLPAEGPAVLCVGQPADFPAARVEPALQADEIAVQAAGSTLYLLGGSEEAVSNAVYTFLDRLGCRWYMPGEMGECIPTRPTVEVGELRLRERPAFAMRQPWYAWGNDGYHCDEAGWQRWVDWRRRNRCGGESLNMGHNLLGPIRGMFEEHPEYFALVNGKRKETQPCTSNPALVPIYVAAVCRYFEQNPAATSYSLSEEDNAEFCECAACRALDSGRIDPLFHLPVVTDRLVKFYNQVAVEVAKRYPDKQLGFLGYLTTTEAPTTVKLEPNLAVCLTTQQFCTIHGVADPCTSRERMRRILATYAGQTKHVSVYEYEPAPGTAGLPYPNFLSHARALRVYHQLGIAGMSIESHKAWASTMPDHWFLARGLWHPDFDADAALGQMCRDLYGPAAAPMERYYRTLAAAIERSPAHPPWWLEHYDEIWRPADVAVLLGAVREAERLARGAAPLVRGRVLAAKLECELLAGYLEFLRCRQAGEVERALQAGDRMMGCLTTQYRLNPDLCLYQEAVPVLGRLVIEYRQAWPYTPAFADRNDLVAHLPKVWRLRADPEDVGQAERWYAQPVDDRWTPVRIDESWIKQPGYEKLPPTAWARSTFTVPEGFRRRQLILFIGALDEGGDVYLNGQLVHHRVTGTSAMDWFEPFEVDITKATRVGRNDLVVRATAGMGVGGLRQPTVLVYSPKAGQRWHPAPTIGAPRSTGGH